MNIALNSCHQYFTRFLRFLSCILLLNEGCQPRYGLLHHPGALDHLWQEHLSRSEQIAYLIHAIHQRTINQVHRKREHRSRLSQIGFNELVNTLYQ